MTLGLALYRIVQESLSNVVKHAPGKHVQLTVEVTNGIVRATVANPLPVAVGNRYGSPNILASPSIGARDEGLDGNIRPVASTGQGVRGMTERAQLLKGALRAGPQAGSWMVEATIPLETSGP